MNERIKIERCDVATDIGGWAGFLARHRGITAYHKARRRCAPPCALPAMVDWQERFNHGVYEAHLDSRCRIWSSESRRIMKSLVSS